MLWFGPYRRYLRAKPKRLGRWGERFAARYLRRKGHHVIARNWRHGRGELDIVSAGPDGAIVFVEVKTQRDEKWQRAQDDVGYKKQKRIAKTAVGFIKKYGIRDKPLRFDVIAVVLPEKGPVEIRHYEKAFRPAQL